MKERKIVLVSGSPRRKELLEKLGFNFSVKLIDVDESYSSDIPVDAIAEYLSVKKFNAYIETGVGENELIITADTVVIKDKNVLGKPVDLDEAEKIIGLLSNSWHKVITGVCLGNTEKKISFSTVSNVFVEKLSSDEIKYYINNYQVLDKAGAYGIQDWLGMAKISKIEGSYFNIMGLPTHELYEKIKTF